MKFAILIALALATASTAQAKLTPYDGTRQAKAPDVVSLYTGPAAAELERDYFSRPAGDDTHAGRCTMQTFVFTKMRLAEACY